MINTQKVSFWVRGGGGRLSSSLRSSTTPGEIENILRLVEEPYFGLIAGQPVVNYNWKKWYVVVKIRNWKTYLLEEKKLILN